MQRTIVFASGLISSFGASVQRPLSQSHSYVYSSSSTSFECPNCAAKHEVVRVEAPPGPTTDREITCLSFGGPLHGREGRFLLKYFMIERPKRRAANRARLSAKQQSKYRAKPCSPRFAAAQISVAPHHLGRINADQRAERCQGRCVFSSI
jgi:hypothetical protein